MKKDVFISYSSIQEEEAIRICAFLESYKVSCFVSTRDIVPGVEYAEQLLEAIDNAKVIVLLLSQEANDSPHVLREVEYAVSHKKAIIVYALEEVVLSRSLEYYLMTHQWLSEDDMRDVTLLTSIRNILSDKDVDFELQLAESVQKKKAERKVVVYPKWMIILIIVLTTILIILIIFLIIDIRSGVIPRL